MKYNVGLYPALARIAEAVKPKNYLEIGTREGDSLATVIGASGPQLDLVVCCDTWGSAHGGSGRGDPGHIQARLDRIHYKGERIFLTGDSKLQIPLFIESYYEHRPPLFDLILVDGDHTRAGAWEDMTNAWPLLRIGGVMVVDDLIHDHYPHLNQTFLDFARQAQAEVVLHETRVYSGVGAIRKTAEARFTITYPKELQMKRAYLVCGLPSSGNKLMTRLLIGAGCFGDADPVQRLDAGYPSLEGQENVVLIRSVPHGDRLPNLNDELAKMRFAMYHPTVVVMVRDFNAMRQSQARMAHPGAGQSGYNQKALRHLAAFIASLDPQVPVEVVSYDAMVRRPKEYGPWVLKKLGFQDVSGVDFDQIEDRNQKYYGLAEELEAQEEKAETDPDFDVVDDEEKAKPTEETLVAHPLAELNADREDADLDRGLTEREDVDPEEGN